MRLWNPLNDVLLQFLLLVPFLLLARRSPGSARTRHLLIVAAVLLTLLNQAFANRSWKFAGVHFGWAAVMTSLLFGATHGFFLNDDSQARFNAFAFGRTLLDGFLFALLTEKMKSLVPSIVLHNLLNLIGNH